ncbi:MAG: S8 family peptidase [Patescibacteria group bacterium]
MVKKGIAVLSFVALTLATTALSSTKLQASQNESKRFIVQFSDALNDAAQDELVANFGGVKIKELSPSNTRVVVLPNRASERALRLNADVVRMEEDGLAFASGRTSVQPAQTLPWGVDRVDAELVWPNTNTNTVRVGVIDTGISLSHPDLSGNIKGEINAINPKRSANDDNGHGSHVAGIIGAVNNTIGVVGVAPEVDLYAIKVLGANGSGYLSDIIEGLDWSIANGMQVVNMSLGASSDNQFLHEAVIRARNAGIVLVVAAGNSGSSVEYPGKYSEVITVGATDVNNQIASFSSRGPEVDVAAPGVSVFSTYKGSGYATLSGTSMATPHVTGIVALILNSPVGVSDLNGDGQWNPDEVQNKLQATATDLGEAGRDDLYGFGLVNAFNAVQ